MVRAPIAVDETCHFRSLAWGTTEFAGFDDFTDENRRCGVSNEIDASHDATVANEYRQTASNVNRDNHRRRACRFQGNLDKP